MDPKVRGAVVATNRIEGQRNSIGAHGGSYSVYRALSVATGRLDPVCNSACLALFVCAGSSRCALPTADPPPQL